MFKSALGLTAFAAVAVASTSAYAQCVTVDPVIVPQVRADPLDAGASAEMLQPFALTFRRATTDDGPIDIRYQIVDEDSSAIARVGLSKGPMVAWTSAESQRDIGALRSGSSTLLHSGVARLSDREPADQRTVTLRLSDLRADLPAGVYREQFTVRFWCEAGETGAPYEATGAVSVSVAVPNVLSASVAGASLRGEIDFMNFEALSRSIQISVRSTGPYRVTARSLNGGVLLRDAVSGPPGEADRIAYSAALDGESLDVEGRKGLVRSRSGLAGQKIPLDIRVEGVSQKRAGRYADTLFLTLEPAN